MRTPEGLHPTRFPSERHRPLGESSRCHASAVKSRACATREQYIGRPPPRPARGGGICHAVRRASGGSPTTRFAPRRDRFTSAPRSVVFRTEIGSLPARDRGSPAGRAAGRWNCHDPGQRDPALLRAVGLHGEDVVGAGVSPARSPAEHEGARETDPRDRMYVRMTLETRGVARVGEILAITRFSARVSGIRAVNVILADIDAARTRTKTEARRVTAGSLRTSASGAAAPEASGTSMSISTARRWTPARKLCVSAEGRAAPEERVLRTDLGPEVNRSRHGIRPISGRK